MSDRGHKGNPVLLWVSRLALTTASLFGGVGFAILVLKLRPQTGMGFDGIADALGALFLGVVGGAGVGFASSLFLRAKANWIAAVAVALIGLPLLFVASRLPQNRGEIPEPVRPFEPAFTVQMYSRIAPGDPGPPTEAGDFRYRELSVSAVDRRLSSKGWGDATSRSYCSGLLSETELEHFSSLAKAMFDAGVENCPTAGRGTFSLSIQWQGENRGVAGFGFLCGEQPEVSAFLAAFDQARAQFVGDGACH